jgi:single-stranded DNA-binding protein
VSAGWPSGPLGAFVFDLLSLWTLSLAAEGIAVTRKRLNDGNKRQSVEIQVTHVGPDLQFATAAVAKSTAEGLGSSSEASSSAEEKQSA